MFCIYAKYPLPPYPCTHLQTYTLVVWRGSNWTNPGRTESITIDVHDLTPKGASIPPRVIWRLFFSWVPGLAEVPTEIIPLPPSTTFFPYPPLISSECHKNIVFWKRKLNIEIQKHDNKIIELMNWYHDVLPITFEWTGADGDGRQASVKAISIQCLFWMRLLYMSDLDRCKLNIFGRNGFYSSSLYYCLNLYFF